MVLFPLFLAHNTNRTNDTNDRNGDGDDTFNNNTYKHTVMVITIMVTVMLMMNLSSLTGIYCNTTFPSPRLFSKS